jgi:hypothetical protein
MDPVWLYFGGATNGTNVGVPVIDDLVVTAIPEPASMALLSLAAMMFCGARRNKR